MRNEKTGKTATAMMLVVMALITTMITIPILNLLGIEDRSKVRGDAVASEAA